MHVPLDSITLGILRGESYNGIRALVDLFMMLKYPTSILVPLPENGGCIFLHAQSSSFFLLFFPSTFTPTIHGAAIPSTTLYPHEGVPRATTLYTNNCHIWL